MLADINNNLVMSWNENVKSSVDSLRFKDVNCEGLHIINDNVYFIFTSGTYILPANRLFLLSHANLTKENVVCCTVRILTKIHKFDFYSQWTYSVRWLWHTLQFTRR